MFYDEHAVDHGGDFGSVVQQPVLRRHSTHDRGVRSTPKRMDVFCGLRSSVSSPGTCAAPPARRTLSRALSRHTSPRPHRRNRRPTLCHSGCAGRVCWSSDRQRARDQNQEQRPTSVHGKFAIRGFCRPRHVRRAVHEPVARCGPCLSKTISRAVVFVRQSDSVRYAEWMAARVIWSSSLSDKS